MRYSELAGKEIVDISEGVRLGIASTTDLVIDTEQGTLEALAIYQRTGFLSTKEIMLSWRGIKKVGRDLIIVDMTEAVSQDPMRSRLPQPSGIRGSRGLSPQPEHADEYGHKHKGLPVKKVIKHRVPGMETETSSDIAAEDAMLVEDEAPELILSRMVRNQERNSNIFWRRSRHSRSS